MITTNHFTLLYNYYNVIWYIYLYVWPTTSHQYKWTAQLLLNLDNAQVVWNTNILLFRRGFVFSFLFTTLRCLRSSHPCRVSSFGVGNPLLTKPFFIAGGFGRKPTRNKYLQDAITQQRQILCVSVPTDTDEKQNKHVSYPTDNTKNKQNICRAVTGSVKHQQAVDIL